MSEATQGYRVLGLELGLGEPEAVVRERALAAAGVGPELLRGFRIARKSLDARRRGGARKLRFVVHAEIELDAGPPPAALSRALRAGRVVPAPQRGAIEVARVHASARGAHVAVVGAGPAGLFAALVLARSGVRVELIDRGPALRARGPRRRRLRQPPRARSRSEPVVRRGRRRDLLGRKALPRVDIAEVPLLEELVACAAPPRCSTTRARTSEPTSCIASCPSCARARGERVRFCFGVR